MNGKPVIETPAKTVVNFKSGFEHKLLCDGMTFSMGDACTYSCSFCYVPSVMRKRLAILEKNGAIPVGTEHEAVVLRRKGGLEIMRKQLQGKRGMMDASEKGKVIYASPLVDIAGNVELADETIEACKLILDLTPWDIRLLSKSPLITRIAVALGDIGKERVVFGLSTGTGDDAMAKAFEQGCPLVSKRFTALWTLQDRGNRTFGMICPSLPHRDYESFAEKMTRDLRIDRMEHVWAEVMNVRGESMVRTCKALSDAGYEWEATSLKSVSESKTHWEEYARETFVAHTKYIPGSKLRFLQYVNDETLPWWNARVKDGAVLL